MAINMLFLKLVSLFCHTQQPTAEAVNTTGRSVGCSLSRVQGHSLHSKSSKQSSCIICKFSKIHEIFQMFFFLLKSDRQILFFLIELS